MEKGLILIENERLPVIGNVNLIYEMYFSEGEWSLRCAIRETGEEAVAEHVTTEEKTAESILRQIARGRVTPVTFMDVLYDLME